MSIEYVDKVSVELIDASASDNMVALAAWVSNANDDVEKLDDEIGVQRLINFLYRNRHMSPFEHGHITVKVDVPLFVAREWQRHRTMSYNEVSGRYTEFEPRFYLPARQRPLVQEGKMGDYTFVEGDNSQFAITKQAQHWAVENAWRSYANQLNAGVAKEVARMVLPVSLMTQFYVTVNPRNLMQFLSLRNDKHALYEIRDAAVQLEKIFAEVMPKTYRAYKRYRLEMVDQNTVSVSDEELTRANIALETYVPRHKKNSKQVIEDSPLKATVTYAGNARDAGSDLDFGGRHRPQEVEQTDISHTVNVYNNGLSKEKVAELLKEINAAYNGALAGRA